MDPTERESLILQIAPPRPGPSEEPSAKNQAGIEIDLLRAILRTLEEVRNELRSKEPAKERKTLCEATDRQKVDDFQNSCGEFGDQLNGVANAFSSVGGTRTIVVALKDTAVMVASLYEICAGCTNSLDYGKDDRGFWTTTKETLKHLAESLGGLRRAMLDVNELLPYKYDNIGECESFLRGCGAKIEQEQDSRNLSRYFIDEFPAEFSKYVISALQELGNIRDRGIDQLKNVERNEVLRYTNMTTIAIFFSSVTATTLQFSFADANTALKKVVNLFWFSSLVFSIASAINSLLAITRRTSPLSSTFRKKIDPKTFKFDRVYEQTPRIILLWLNGAPMVLLVLAACAFIIGLTLFAFSSQQGKVVVAFTTTLVSTHVVALTIITLIFLLEFNGHMAVSEALTRSEFWIEDKLKNARRELKDVPIYWWPIMPFVLVIALLLDAIFRIRQTTFESRRSRRQKVELDAHAGNA